MPIREGFPDSPTPEEIAEINTRTVFASDHLYSGSLAQANLHVDYHDMYRRQAVSRLVVRIPGEGGNYGITQENRAKVAGILGVGE